MKHTRGLKRFATTLVLTALAAGLPISGWSSEHQNDPNGIQWQGWSDAVFEQAKKENKFVVLDLEAVWCHWCHVMEQETYHNPAVIEEMKKHYIGVKVDQDSRPDLSNRYLAYGWPATIFFGPDGKEIAKRAGFMEPSEFLTLLKEIVEDPTPETSDTVEVSDINKFAESPFLPADERTDLEKKFVDQYDTEKGAWSIGSHKYMDWDSMEYAITRARQGDKQAEQMALQTLPAAIKLLDPVWGGIYQYSTHYDWDHAHFEKIMSVQTQNIVVYSEAYAQWKDPRYLNTAVSVYNFLNNFLKDPNGAFYTSMDADVVQGEHSEEYFTKLNDAERRAQGIPRIDKHQYARENGWVVQALLSLYNVTGEQKYLNEALTATNWVIANRSLPNGGFSHDAKDIAGPFLGDTLAMGRAFLMLYQATGNRDWLTRSEAAADYIEANFRNVDGKPGYVASANQSGVAKPLPLRDENVNLVRFANSLYHTTANKKYRDTAETAMKFVATPEVANEPFVGATLLANEEISKDPTHITIVGHKDDPQAQALYKTALKYPAIYKRLDWWDKREGAMPNPDVQYPELEKAAAFVCTDKRCSLPVFEPKNLSPLVDRLSAAKLATPATASDQGAAQ